MIEAGYSVIAGGGRTSFYDAGTGNTIWDVWGTIGGGGNNKAGTDNGDCTDAKFTTISGGEANLANASWATVGGGNSNQVLSSTKSGYWGTIGGGFDNTVTDTAGTIAGGMSNLIRGWGGSIGGGDGNDVIGDFATIGGGQGNTVGGAHSTIPGGYKNVTDGTYSLAAGNEAWALYNGSFVWSDNSLMPLGPYESTDHGQFLIAAAGASASISRGQSPSIHRLSWI